MPEKNHQLSKKQTLIQVDLQVDKAIIFFKSKKVEIIQKNLKKASLKTPKRKEKSKPKDENSNKKLHLHNKKTPSCYHCCGMQQRRNRVGPSIASGSQI
jgi:hypothetical protein